MAEWQTRKLNSVSESGESIEERVQREKQERWEASDEYAEEQKKKGATNTNIELSNASQVTHEDIAAEKHSEQGDKAALLGGCWPALHADHRAVNTALPLPPV